jgi:hypothetical protein
MRSAQAPPARGPAAGAAGAQAARRAPPPLRALPPDALAHLAHAAATFDAGSFLADVAARAPLALEPVVLPCHNMGCGDAVYRR